MEAAGTTEQKQQQIEIIPIKKAVRYNYQTSWLEYKEEFKNPEPREVYFRVILGYTRGVGNAIIVDKYEWKIPYYQGYLRIDKDEKFDAKGNLIWRWCFWRWDNKRNIMHWPKPSLWGFKACEGKHIGDVGETGLRKHIVALKNDKTKPNYDVFKKKRGVRPIPFDDFCASIDVNKLH